MLSRLSSSDAHKRRQFRPGVELLESRDAPTAAPGNDLLFKPYPTANVFQLHSNPGANHVIYLDYDGETVAGTQWNTDANGGQPFTVEAWSMDNDRTTLTAAERTKIIDMWRMVAEDFIPFNIDVTTQNPGLEALRKTSAADLKWGMHVILGPVPSVSNGSFFSGAGGIAYLNSFNDPIDTPCFVFNGDSSATPEDSLPVSVSHEVGHTFGLTHDGTASAGYYSGHGSGNTGWGPIMGAPFGINVTQWSRNTYPGANNAQDDLQIIVTGHGFGYRADDYGNTAGTAKALNTGLQATLNTTYGIIGKNTDVDYFAFFADPGPIDIKIDQLMIGPNLDIKADLYSPSGALLSSSNPLNELYAKFALNVPVAGRYTIKVVGTGLAPVLPTGYPTYGSMGNYQISGKVTPMSATGASFRSTNPARWAYAAGVYSGYITIANITQASFTGTFTIVLTLPDASVKVLSPGMNQSGNKVTITYTGSLVPNQPLRLYLRLTNPLHFVLGTGYNTFVTSITSKN